MLDIQIIRNETERVKAAVARKKFAVDIDELLSVDARRRELAGQVDGLGAPSAKRSPAPSLASRVRTKRRRSPQRELLESGSQNSKRRSDRPSRALTS